MKSGADINAQNSNGNTPLFTAVQTLFHNKDSRCQDLINALVSFGADINATNSAGETPLFAALLTPFPNDDNSSQDLINALVSFGADTNVINNAGRTLLHAAADSFSCNSNVLRTLKNFGISVNSRDNEGLTPLHNVIQRFSDVVIQSWRKRGQWYQPEKELLDNIKELVALGAEVNAGDKQGNTPLHWAARQTDNANMVEVLCKLGAKMEA